MDPTVVTVIVVAVVVLVVVGLVGLLRRRKQTTERREHLQEKFGPEYDRAVHDADDQREAESRLEAAERRRNELDIRPLTSASRRRRVQQWDSVQAMFVDEPVEAVDSADRLVADVMAERGYPTGDVDDKLAMLAADHAETVDHYRTAEGHRNRFHSGEGSTEDLRRAFVEYRRLFDVLVEDGASDRTEDADRDSAVDHDSAADGGDRPRTVTRPDDATPDDTSADHSTDTRTDHSSGTRSDTRGDTHVDRRADGSESRHPDQPVGQHAARPDADEVDLRDTRDPAPTATPVRSDDTRSARLGDG